MKFWERGSQRPAGIWSFFYEVVDQVMVDLPHNDLIGEMIDAHIERFSIAIRPQGEFEEVASI